MTPQARSAPEPKPYRGPVLICDVVDTWGGRPVLLTHWDERDPDQ